MKDRVTAMVTRADCQRLSCGSMRQRASVPISRPNPVVCAVAMAAMPARCAVSRVTPVFRSR